jgi:hypothetical protein
MKTASAFGRRDPDHDHAAGDDWKTAVRDVRAVIADALKTPPSREEIQRELAEFDVSYKVPVETQETQAGSNWPTTSSRRSTSAKRSQSRHRLRHLPASRCRCSRPKRCWPIPAAFYRDCRTRCPRHAQGQ